VKNKDSLKNPESLDFFETIIENVFTGLQPGDIAFVGSHYPGKLFLGSSLFYFQLN